MSDDRMPYASASGELSENSLRTYERDGVTGVPAR